MTPFIHEDFLLETDVARDLYHRFAADLPIIDYHCHLPVAQIAGDHVRSGLLPDDRNLLAALAQDVSFFNAREYLGLDLGRLGRNVERVA